MIAKGQVYELQVPLARHPRGGRYAVTLAPKGSGLAALRRADGEEIAQPSAVLEDGQTWALVGAGPARRTRRVKRAQHPAFTSVHHPGGGARILISMRTESEGNRRDHWATKARRVAQQRRDIAWAWRAARAQHPAWPASFLPCTVILVRQAPRVTDDDVDQRSLKAVRDQLAVELGLPVRKLAPGQRTPVADDSDKRVQWEYGAPRKGPPAVEITIVPTGGAR